MVQVRKGNLLENVWADAFQCKRAVLLVTYLGLPLGAKTRLKSLWNPILSRAEKRLAPWKRKFLNKGGRLVLIKLVLSSIPSYFFSVFLVPLGVAKALEKLQRSFFWGDGLAKRKIHAVD